MQFVIFHNSTHSDAVHTPLHKEKKLMLDSVIKIWTLHEHLGKGNGELKKWAVLCAVQVNPQVPSFQQAPQHLWESQPLLNMQ